MKLSDLRKVVSNEAMLRFTVTSLPGNDGTYDSIETGDMLFFDADASLDGLEVTSLAAQNALMGKTDALNDDVEKPVLAVGVSCSEQMLHDTDWKSAFNGSVVESSSSGAAGTISGR